MNLEDKYLLLNFDTDDLAEQMTREEDEKYPPISDDKHINIVLKEEGLSIKSLEGSFATIHNVDNKLFIKFDENSRIYTPTLLKFIEAPLYIKFVTSFDSPKKVKLLNVSSQIGGYIDTNYGIKFKILLTEQKADDIYTSTKPKNDKKKFRKQADIYIRRKFRYSLNDESYDADINTFIIMMKDFFREGLGQIKYCNNMGGNFSILYRKDQAFNFVKYDKEFYGIVEINSIFFVYKVIDEDVYMIGDGMNMNGAKEAISKHVAAFL